MSAKGAILIVPSAVAAVMAGWQLHRMQWKVSIDCNSPWDSHVCMIIEHDVSAEWSTCVREL